MSAELSSRRGDAGGGALALQVFERLRDEIVSGALRPGDRLLRREIAQRFGVSNTPVLEALIRLEQTGLIDSGPAQTPRVREVTLDGILNDYVMREAIEVQAIRLATQSVTETEIAELYIRADFVDEKVAEHIAEGKVSLVDPEWAFHLRIAQLSRYPVLARELERINLQYLFRINFMPFETPAESTPDHPHRQLVDSMVTRDPEIAEIAMREHLRRGRENSCAAFLRHSMGT